jgi:hypothetical protein
MHVFFLNAIVATVFQSTSEELKLDHKSISCSYTISASAKVEFLRVDESSGSEEIDKKALAILNRTCLREISPPPNTTPFYGILVKFFDGCLLSIGLKPHPLPKSSALTNVPFLSKPSELWDRPDMMSDKPGFNAPDVHGF